MLMWYVILGLLILTTAAALFYLSNRVTKFVFIAKLSKGNKKISRAIGASIVILIFGGLWLSINLMNAVVFLIHFAAFWLLCDFIFWLAQKIKKQPFKHYYAGITAIFLSLISLSIGWYLDHYVWTTSYIIESNKNIKDLRIIQFADSHIGTTFGSQGFAEHINEMQKQNPDMVVIVGDFVDDGTSREEMVAACQALGKLKTTYGVYFAFGNHDKGYYNPAIRGFTGNDLITELKKNNVKILEDEVELINNMFYIVGRKDISELQRGGSRMEMKELVKNLDKNKFIIVLDHQPNDYKNQAETKVDLVLSGHTHGGQLWPLNKVGEWIGANDRTYGREKRNQTDFIVTSGLSDWAIKIKTGTKSEFVVIDIKPKMSAN